MHSTTHTEVQVLEEMLNLVFQNLEQPLTNMNELYHKEQILLLSFYVFFQSTQKWFQEQSYVIQLTSSVQ